MQCGSGSRLYLLLLVALVVSTACQAATGLCHGVVNSTCGPSCQLHTCQALVTLYKKTQGPARAGDAGPGWTLPSRAGWEVAAASGCDAYLNLTNVQDLTASALHVPPRYCQEFYGITCCRNATSNSSRDGSEQQCAVEHAVTELSLKVNHVNGSINDPQLMQILLLLGECGLQVLDFEQGRLSGSVTAAWAQLTGLRVLQLTGNWISGTIPPELGDMASLEVLLLDNNFLTGTIPPELAKLKNLQQLNLAAQAFLTIDPRNDSSHLSATLNPDGLGGLEGLGLVGTIPSSITSLPNLIEFNVEVNQLEGTLPNPVCGPNSQLQVFSVRRNNISGSAMGVQACDNLVHLDLSMNSLTGPLPANASWSSLVLYLAADNMFTGALPSDLYRANFLAYLDISYNRLSSGLNDSLALMTYLQYLDASNNNFAGSIPLGLFYLSALHTLDLSYNQLSSQLPWSVGFAASLSTLRLSYNALTGRIPEELGHVASLSTLELLNTRMLADGFNYNTASAAAAGGSNGSTSSALEDGTNNSNDNSSRIGSSTIANGSTVTSAGSKHDNLAVDAGYLLGPESQRPPRKLLASPGCSSALPAAAMSGPGAAVAVKACVGQSASKQHARATGLQRSRWQSGYQPSFRSDFRFLDLLAQLADKRSQQQWVQRRLPAASFSSSSHRGLVSTPTPAAAPPAAAEAAASELAFAVEWEFNSTTEYNGDGGNNGMPCWLALSNQNAPPPFESSALLAGDEETDRRLRMLQSASLTCPLIVRRGESLSYPWTDGSSGFSWLCPYREPAQAQPSINWLIDPVYYGYQKCTCSSGYYMAERYDPVLDLNRKFCRRQQGMPTWAVVLLAVFTPLFGILLLLLVLIFSNHAWHQIRFKPKYVRRLELHKRRSKGAPKAGEYASVVVTDIEGYTSLMAAEPHLATAALGVHNSAVRKALYANAGAVLEQEGDSYTVAFHKPLDAVAFCLQVQLILQNTNWRSLKSRTPSGSSTAQWIAACGGSGGSSSRSKYCPQSAGPLDTLFSSTIDGASTAKQHDQVQQAPQHNQQQQQRQQQFVTLPTTNSSVPIAATAATAANGSDPRGGRYSSFVELCGLSFSAPTGSAKLLGGADGDSPVHDQQPQQLEQQQQQKLTGFVSTVADDSAVPADGIIVTRGLVGRLSPVGMKQFSSHHLHNPTSQPIESFSSNSFGLGCFSCLGLREQGSGSRGISGFSTLSRPSGNKQNGRQGIRLAGTKGWRQGKTARQLVSPFAAASNTSLSARSTSRSSSSRFWQLLLPGLHDNGAVGDSEDSGIDMLFNGLRVRMGVASGMLPADMEDINTSWLVNKAKVVSDFGAGGQVLLDAPTFMAVKDGTHELGCVDESGVNLSHLEAAAWATLFCPWSSSRAVRATPDATLLDMGTYKLAAQQQQHSPHRPPAAATPAVHSRHPQTTAKQPSGFKGVAASFAAKARAAWHPPSRCCNYDSNQSAHDGFTCETAAAAAAASGMQQQQQQCCPDGVGFGASQGRDGVLHVYQVLHPSLVIRAHVLGNQLHLGEVEHILDLPYFDAPGALHANLAATYASTDGSNPHSRTSGISSLNPQPQWPLYPLPSVTMVFARVEGGKQFLLRDKHEGSGLNEQVVQVLLAGLKAVPGGYLCRVQEAEMKYMLAFYDAQDALQWCLYVQELLLWQPWSARVLGAMQFREVCAGAPAAAAPQAAQAAAVELWLPVFRGPRLKMGLCEGSPRSLMPDHLGRADYHGSTVNQAARYMEVAAHGGQVVCGQALAERVCAIWQGKQQPELSQVLANSSFAEAAGHKVINSSLVTTDSTAATAAADSTHRDAASCIDGGSSSGAIPAGAGATTRNNNNSNNVFALGKLRVDARDLLQAAAAPASAFDAAMAKAALADSHVQAWVSCHILSTEAAAAAAAAQQAAVAAASSTRFWLGAKILTERRSSILKQLRSKSFLTVSNSITNKATNSVTESADDSFSTVLSSRGDSGSSKASMQTLMTESPAASPNTSMTAMSGRNGSNSSSVIRSTVVNAGSSSILAPAGHVARKGSGDSSTILASAVTVATQPNGITSSGNSGSSSMFASGSSVLAPAGHVAGKASDGSTGLIRVVPLSSETEARNAQQASQQSNPAISGTSAAANGSSAAAYGNSPVQLARTSSSSSRGQSSKRSSRSKADKPGHQPQLNPAAALPANPSTVLELSTVAIPRRMLQSSLGKFTVSSQQCAVQVEVRDLGLFRFKGVNEPVAMAYLTTQRLAGRAFPVAAPDGKGSRIAPPRAAQPVTNSATVLLPQLPSAAAAVQQAWLQYQQQQPLARLQSQQQQCEGIEHVSTHPCHGSRERTEASAEQQLYLADVAILGSTAAAAASGTGYSDISTDVAADQADRQQVQVARFSLSGGPVSKQPTALTAAPAAAAARIAAAAVTTNRPTAAPADTVVVELTGR